MAIVAFVGLVVVVVAFAVWRSGAGTRNRGDVRMSSPEVARGGLPGVGDHGGFSGGGV